MMLGCCATGDGDGRLSSLSMVSEMLLLLWSSSSWRSDAPHSTETFVE